MTSCYAKSRQADFCSCTLRWSSDPPESTLGRPRYLFKGMAPHLNSPPTGVLFSSKGHNFGWVVFHWQLCVSWRKHFFASYLRYTSEGVTQRQAAVKLHGVFASPWGSLDFSPGCKVHRVPARDSRRLIPSFVQAAN